MGTIGRHSWSNHIHAYGSDPNLLIKAKGNFPYAYINYIENPREALTAETTYDIAIDPYIQIGYLPTLLTKCKYSCIGYTDLDEKIKAILATANHSILDSRKITTTADAPTIELLLTKHISP